jgi:hypothetical protein
MTVPATVLTLAANGAEVAKIAVGGSLALGFFAILTGFLRRLMAARAREQTKREIAASIAEGTMTPEDGERILRAEPGPPGSGRDA